MNDNIYANMQICQTPAHIFTQIAHLNGLNRGGSGICVDWSQARCVWVIAQALLNRDAYVDSHNNRSSSAHDAAVRFRPGC